MFDVNETIRMFSEQYYKKIFYFSLKKTGNQTQAEDLASEIALDVISALRKGTIPEQFSAYVWKCARNRYAKWVEKRVKSRDNSTELDENFVSDEYSLEDDYIQQEDLKKLRRELALVSKDYREILVSFYIEDKKTSQISREFNLPEGTIKRKLFESRKILKESMKMAREFGPKSYKPEDVQLWTSGKGVHGRGPGPHIDYGKQLVKNILLEAYCNPSTVEELSLELGIAAPYMEDEVKILVENELLTDLGNGKYETAFPILSAEAQRQIEHAKLKAEGEYTKLVRELIFDVLDDFFAKYNNEKLFGVAQTQTFEELKWMYMLLLAQELDKKTRKEEKPIEDPPVEEVYTKREQGYWDMMGLENNTEIHKFPEYIGHNGSSVMSDENTWQYAILSAPATFCFYNLHSYIKGQEDRYRSVDNHQAGVIWDMYNGIVDEVKNKETIEELLDMGVFEVKGGKYIPKFIITHTYGHGDAFAEEYVSTLDETVWNKIVALRMQVAAEVQAIVSKDVPEKLHNPILKRFSNDTNLGPLAMRAAVEGGYLEIPDDIQKSMIGAFMMVPKKD